MKIFQNIQNRIDEITGSSGEQGGRLARLIHFQIKLWRFCLLRLRANNAMAMSAALSFRTIFALVPTLVLILLIVKSLGVIQDSQAGLQQLLNVGGLNIAVNYDAEDPSAKAAAKSESAPAESIGENAPNQSSEGRQGGYEQADKDNVAPQGSTPAGSPSADAAPKTGRQINVAETIHKLVAKVETQLTFGRIGPIGVALLIWTAITLLATIERSLNRIYGVQKSRSLARQVMMYWTVLTLGPIILVVVKFLGGRAMSVSAKIPGLSWLLLSFGWAMPIIVGILLLGLLYKLLPNTRVSFRWALAGAIIAVPCWVAAKWAFGLYVSEVVVAKKSLYGALGLLPIFLMWMNMSWWIFLLGAELSQVLANFRRMESAELAEKITTGPMDSLAAALAIAASYEAGRGPAPFERIAADLKLPEPAAQRILDQLAERGLICPLEGKGGTTYTLAMPADQIQILNICSLDGQAESARTARYDQSIAARITAVQTHARGAMGAMTLGDAIKM